MTTPSQERREWSARAPDLAMARRAIWNTDTPTEAERLDLLLRFIEPALRPVLRKGARVLDLGCGVGDLTRAMARRHPAASFIGIDVSEAMLDLARAQPKGPGTIRYVLGDGRTLPRVGALNGAWSVIVFQHIPEDAKRGYVREVSDRLKPGGVFRFQFVAGNNPGDADPADVARWCGDAELRVEAASRGDVFPTWAWMTAVKQ